MFGFENMLHDEFTELPFKIMFYVIIFLFGICIGSFLNVVILRLPKGESVIGLKRSKEDKEKSFSLHDLRCQDQTYRPDTCFQLDHAERKMSQLRCQDFTAISNS